MRKLSLYNSPSKSERIHSTAAVYYYNGSKLDTAHVTADMEYESLMQRLSDTPYSRQTIFQRYMRRINKALGRPATADVGTLSRMLSKIKSATEAALSIKLDKAAIAAPKFDSLTLEDLNDAANYAGLHSWMEVDDIRATRMSEGHAAFSANGYGLCQNYRNYFWCLDEFDDEWEQVYAIGYTRKALYTTLFETDVAFFSSEQLNMFDFNAGVDSASSFSTESDYWDHVKKQLSVLPKSQRIRDPSWVRRQISVLLLLGESASNPKFLSTVKDALAELDVLPSVIDRALTVRQDVMSVRVADPLFAAARGAAIYARWKLEGLGDCQELNSCFEQRRREHERNGSVADMVLNSSQNLELR